MSFALVVLATITLVVGLLQSGLTLIYVSIGCSVLAGLVLAVAVLRGRPEEAPVAPVRPSVPAGAGAGPGTATMPTPTPPAPSTARPWETASTTSGAAASEPAPSTVPSWRAPESDTATPPAATPPPAPVPVPDFDEEDEDEEEEEELVEARPAPALGGVLGSRWARDRAAREDRTEQVDVVSAMDEDEEDEFPIENYDRLRASEILRQLPDLSPRDLELVREREVAGMNRFTVLSRIDAQLETATTATDWDIDETAWEGGEEEPQDIDDTVDEPAPAPVAAAPAPPRRTTRRQPPAGGPAIKRVTPRK
ncbi:MAG TPA: hypothetical protein VJ874_02515, partial [Candidatus Thermoplasmatota archaeon]|nr:hypothetical protein [Candidatus Thermoplasmatota archaeon]